MCGHCGICLDRGTTFEEFSGIYKMTKYTLRRLILTSLAKPHFWLVHISLSSLDKQQRNSRNSIATSQELHGKILSGAGNHVVVTCKDKVSRI